jgi:hypothetical protein
MPTPGEEIAWAAGLFEGEGCMTQSGGRKVMRLASTDEDTVRRFSEIIAVGKIYGPYEQGPPRKPFWVWVASGVDALLALRLMISWLGERRRKRACELFGQRFVP